MLCFMLQAMALNHDGVVEVACNLLDPAASPPEAVQHCIEKLAAEQGCKTGVGSGYQTGKTPEQLTRMHLEAMGGL